MDILDDVRLCQGQKIVIAFYILLPVSKALSAVILLGQRVFLDHRAHRAIKDQYLFLGPFAQQGNAFLAVIHHFYPVNSSCVMFESKRDNQAAACSGPRMPSA